MFLGLEKEWEADDVKLIMRDRISVPIFTLIEKVSIAVASLVVKYLAIVILHFMYFSFRICGWLQKTRCEKKEYQKKSIKVILSNQV